MDKSEWLKQRRGVLTASNAYDMFSLFSDNQTIKEIINQNETLINSELCNLPQKMAVNFQSSQFNKTLYNLYHEKTISENRYLLFNHLITSKSQAIKKGNKLERTVIDAFCNWLKTSELEPTDIQTEQKLIIKEDLRIGATPDAYLTIQTKSSKVQSLLEVKTTADFKESDVLKHTFQVIWQLKCCDLKLGFVYKLNHKTNEYKGWIINSKQYEHFDLIYNEIDDVAKKAWEWLETADPATLQPDPDNKNDRTINEVLQMSEEQVEEALYDYEVLETADPELARLAEIIGQHNLTLADLKEQEKQVAKVMEELKEKVASINHKNLLIQAPDGQKYEVKKIIVAPSYWTQEALDKERAKFEQGIPKKAGCTRLKVEALDYKNV